jgi:RNA polymerase sigma factor (TIGR02999 family)
MLDGMAAITRLLDAAAAGDPHAAAELLPLVYDELRKLAAARMAREPVGHTLSPTALVHEAYLRLAASGDASAPRDQQWNGRGHFFAAAAEAMRRILVEQARQRHAQKRGGQADRLPLDDSRFATPAPDDELLAVHEALEELARADPDAAALVKLRYFAGMTAAEAAAALGLSVRSAHDLWAYARSWLRRRLRSE